MYDTKNELYCGDCNYLSGTNDDTTDGHCDKYGVDLIFYDWFERCQQCLNEHSKINELVGELKQS